MLCVGGQVHLKKSQLVSCLHLVLQGVYPHHNTHASSLALRKKQANGSSTFMLTKRQLQLMYLCVIAVQHLAMPMRLEQKPTGWVEGFPRGPGKCWVRRWIDYSCCTRGFKNNSPAFQKNVFVMESLKRCSKRPRSHWEQAKRQSFFWAWCSLERQIWAVKQGTCSLCSGRQDSVYLLYDKQTSLHQGNAWILICCIVVETACHDPMHWLILRPDRGNNMFKMLINSFITCLIFCFKTDC